MMEWGYEEIRKAGFQSLQRQTNVILKRLLTRLDRLLLYWAPTRFLSWTPPWQALLPHLLVVTHANSGELAVRHSRNRRPCLHSQHEDFNLAQFSGCLSSSFTSYFCVKYKVLTCWVRWLERLLRCWSPNRSSSQMVSQSANGLILWSIISANQSVHWYI